MFFSAAADALLVRWLLSSTRYFFSLVPKDLKHTP